MCVAVVSGGWELSRVTVQYSVFKEGTVGAINLGIEVTVRVRDTTTSSGQRVACSAGAGGMWPSIRRGDSVSARCWGAYKPQACTKGTRKGRRRSFVFEDVRTEAFTLSTIEVWTLPKRTVRSIDSNKKTPPVEHASCPAGLAPSNDSHLAQKESSSAAPSSRYDAFSQAPEVSSKGAISVKTRRDENGDEIHPRPNRAHETCAR